MEVTRRWGAPARLALVALATLAPRAAAADDVTARSDGRETVTTFHLGPLTVQEGQLVMVAATNTGRSTISGHAALLDQEGATLADEPLELGPGESGAIRWIAGATGLVRASVTAPSAPQPALRMYVYEADRGGFTTPVVTLPFFWPRFPKPFTPTLSPYAPIIIAANTALGNLSALPMTYRVSFRDHAGRLLQTQTLTLPGGHSRSVPLTAPAPNGVRTEVAAPDGSAFSFTLELQDTDGRTTAAIEPEG
jgi:hypothetical protein